MGEDVTSHSIFLKFLARDSLKPLEYSRLFLKCWNSLEDPRVIKKCNDSRRFHNFLQDSRITQKDLELTRTFGKSLEVSRNLRKTLEDLGIL